MVIYPTAYNDYVAGLGFEQMVISTMYRTYTKEKRLQLGQYLNIGKLIFHFSPFYKICPEMYELNVKLLTSQLLKKKKKARSNSHTLLRVANTQNPSELLSSSNIPD